MSELTQTVPQQFEEILEPLGERSTEYSRQLQDMVAMDGRLRGAESVYGQCYEMVTALEKKIDNYLASWQ